MASKEKPARIRPCGDRILVKRIEAEERSPGGIIIPDEYRQKGDRGEVLAVGPGRWNDAGTARLPVGVRVGDVVRMPSYAGAEDMRGAVPNGQLLIGEEDLLGVEEK